MHMPNHVIEHIWLLRFPAIGIVSMLLGAKLMIWIDSRFFDSSLEATSEEEKLDIISW